MAAEGRECTAEPIYCPEEQSLLLIPRSYPDFCSHSDRQSISQLWADSLRNGSRLINTFGVAVEEMIV